MRRLKILTWHTHGSYLYYLTRLPHDFYVLSKPGAPAGYAGTTGQFQWGEHVHDLPVEGTTACRFDCVIFQDDPQYLDDQYRYLSPSQRRLPRIYIEHDPPRGHPTDTRHPVVDDDVLVVHVSAFNRLMWDNGNTPTRVIEHGVVAPENVRYSGDLPRGITVVNNLAQRGRRLGSDVFAMARERVALDLVGMGADEAGGLGELPHAQLPAFMAHYRFFFNPIRYTSMGLAVVEAMMSGLPIVALATTEMATVIRNGTNGYADTSLDALVNNMHMLIGNPDWARALGEQARRDAMQRFGIRRFIADWEMALRDVAK